MHTILRMQPVAYRFKASHNPAEVNHSQRSQIIVIFATVSRLLSSFSSLDTKHPYRPYQVFIITVLLKQG